MIWFPHNFHLIVPPHHLFSVFPQPLFPPTVSLTTFSPQLLARRVISSVFLSTSLPSLFSLLSLPFPSLLFPSKFLPHHFLALPTHGLLSFCFPITAFLCQGFSITAFSPPSFPLDIFSMIVLSSLLPQGLSAFSSHTFLSDHSVIHPPLFLIPYPVSP